MKCFQKSTPKRKKIRYIRKGGDTSFLLYGHCEKDLLYPELEEFKIDDKSRNKSCENVIYGGPVKKQKKYPYLQTPYFIKSEYDKEVTKLEKKKKQIEDMRLELEKALKNKQTFM